ncbi:MAG: hypothetical protein KAT23_00885, partial [Anaerolineales bacterium]|nr:hypothetical protein [Anaerolineales bacterium]
RNWSQEIWVFIGVMILAVAPSLLMFLERWVGDQLVRDLFRHWWCKSSFLCNTAYEIWHNSSYREFGE